MTRVRPGNELMAEVLEVTLVTTTMTLTNTMPNLTVEERKRSRNHRMKPGQCLTREIQIRFKNSKVSTVEEEEPGLWNKGGAATIIRHLVVVLSTEDFNNNHKTTVITTTTTVNIKIGIDP